MSHPPDFFVGQMWATRLRNSQQALIRFADSEESCLMLRRG